MEDLCKSEAVNKLEENVDKCFHNLGMEKDFLSMTQKEVKERTLKF